MIKLLIPALLISFHAWSEECSAPLPLDGQPIMELMDKKCFSPEMTNDDIQMELATQKKIKKFCKKCHNPFLEPIQKSEEGKLQKKQKLSETLFAEVEKELSFITLDLMKVRSSFKLPIDPAQARMDCQLDKIEPSCLSTENHKLELQGLKKLIKKSQNTVATELANILSGKTSKGESLLKRTGELKCNDIREQDIQFAQMRYHESLLDSEFIENLREFSLNKSSNLEEEIEKMFKTENNSNFSGPLRKLSTHPIFKSLIQNPDELKKFLASVSPSDKNESIIEKLYGKAPAETFTKNIAQRCSNVVKHTNEILEKIYCTPNFSFIADNSLAMSLVNKKKLTDLNNLELESYVQANCTEMNSITEGTKTESINEFLKLNKHNDPALVSLPKENFKTDAFNRSIGNDGHAICEAQNSNKCAKESKVSECIMLSYIQKTKNDKSYKELAKSSDQNINEILRSLVGAGLPQNEFGVDSYAVNLLKDEGILPGAPKTEHHQPKDVTGFHKETSSIQKSMKLSPVGGAQMAQNSTNHILNSAFENGASESLKPEQSGTKPGIEFNQKSPAFSSLNEDEQKKILNYLKNRPTKQEIKNDSQEKRQDIARTTKETHSFPESQNIPIYDGAPTKTESTSTFMPKITPVTKDQLSASNKRSISESFNKALQDAQLKRSPASVDRQSVPSLSISKNELGINEIGIEASEEDLSKVGLFKEKLKELLSTKSDELVKLQEGEKFIIHINQHEILLIYNQEKKIYEAKCNDKSLPEDYLKTISHYFNVTLKEGPGKREALLKVFNVSQNDKVKEHSK